MKLLEENTGESFCDLGISKDFLDTKSTIHKRNKWISEFIKILKFWSSKDTVTTMNRQATL